MDAILDLLSNSNLQTAVGALFGGGVAGILGVAKKLGFKPTALIGGLLKRGKNPIKELMDVFKVYKAAQADNKITANEYKKINKEIYELVDSIIPYIK